MRLELGEMSEEEFDALEADILARLREIRERRQGSRSRRALAAATTRSPASRPRSKATSTR